MKKENKERVFSVELESKNYLKNVTLNDGANENVVVEGTLGNLLHATFEEDIILEVAGTKGILRLDLRSDEIKKTSKTEATKQ